MKKLFALSLIFLLAIGILSFSEDPILKIPLGFPSPPIPEDNQLTNSRIALGKKLFFDKVMSRDSTLSCATCHKPEYAFTDRLEKAVGIRNQQVSRNAPTLANVVYLDKLLLDAVNPSLEAQVMVPIHEKNEFDFHIILVAERMKKNPEYVKLCEDAYQSEPNPYAITHSIACYERTLISGNSAYDQFKYQGDSTALNSEERRGMSLFFNELYCASCHGGFNFSDQALTNNGLYESYADSGRIRLTGLETDRAVFRVPTLRNIAVTYPYMHDGGVESLDEVIEHYMSGGKTHPNKSSIIQPFQLTKEKKEDLIAFLHSLTDSSFISH
ncbi:MAG TPA: c-type cytochrome [Flavobacteriales bacterium]|nr:c-type cytochrome [Flavobacteriales bacterium]HIO68332.1 c-type cytochrome [Flavobacteriales bacterium]